MNKKKQKGESGEQKFEEFCKQSKISCIYLEKEGDIRRKFLENRNGKCPDFLCSKGNKNIVVEVKTHTLLTNMAREKFINRRIEELRAAGIRSGITSEPFDPIPELKIPFEGYLRDASDKFKNLKIKDYPRVLFLDGFGIKWLDVHAIFRGEYPAYRKDYKKNELVYVGFSKTHKGLFDSTGSNVSAVIYWEPNLKRYEGVSNPNAQAILSEQDFKHFFELS
jgi:hypothetical protein